MAAIASKAAAPKLARASHSVVRVQHVCQAAAARQHAHLRPGQASISTEPATVENS